MKLTIPEEVEQKIHAYVMSVPGEIAGMGKVRIAPDNDNIIVEDVMIYEQEVTAGTADLSPQSIAKWQHELVKAGGSPKQWRLWWHSHASMAAFFSKTDTDTMDRQTEGDWMVSLVVNKRRERQARLDLYRPFRVYMDELGIEIEGEAFTIPADIAAEVAEKVRTPKYTPPAASPIGYHESIATDYTKEQCIAIIETLETTMDDFNSRGLSTTEEAQNIKTELIDAYYELAYQEKDQAISKAVRMKAEKLEEEYYALDEGYQNALLS